MELSEGHRRDFLSRLTVLPLERDTVVSEAYPVLCMALGVKTTKALRGRGSVRGGADPLLLPTTFLQQG